MRPLSSACICRCSECCSAGASQASMPGWVSSQHVLTRTSWRSPWPTRWLALPGRCYPKEKLIGLSCWRLKQLSPDTNGLQLMPGAKRQAWKSPPRFPRSQTCDNGIIELEFTQHLTRSAGEQRDDKMVEPDALETCNTEKPPEAVKLGRTRSAAHSIKVTSFCSRKDRIHLRRPNRHSHFSLAVRRRAIPSYCR